MSVDEKLGCTFILLFAFIVATSLILMIYASLMQASVELAIRTCYESKEVLSVGQLLSCLKEAGVIS